MRAGPDRSSFGGCRVGALRRSTWSVRAFREASDDERVALCSKVPEYGEASRQLLTLATDASHRAWHAVARVDGTFAGRAWAFATPGIAGIYDMEVWPGFRRTGLARALLRTVCGAARAAGVPSAVLNATPDGERVYVAEGFAHIGKGITYWHHLAC